MNFVLAQNFKALNKLVATGKIEEAEVKLRDISSSLSVTDFIPGDLKYKKDALPLLLQNCLPLTSHENMKLRFHAQNTLTHWSALVSAFSPKALLDVFQNFDMTTLQPEAHAAIFSFWANALRFVRPDFRLEYIGFLHSLLISSRAELLTSISHDIWSILRETLTVSNILSLLPILINSPLSKQVSFLCEKSPNQLLTYVLNKGEIQFIKQMLPNWPNQLPIDMKVLSGRLVAALNSNNSSDKSTAIEIVSIIIQRYDSTDAENQESWKELFAALVNLWNTNATIAQKAALIDLFAKTPFIPKEDLQNLIIFDDSVPAQIRISIVRLCSVFVAAGKIPKGLFENLEVQIRERDPLMYVAILTFFANSFNDLYRLAPSHAVHLLESALTPLPKYFVEQVLVIKILRSVNVKEIKGQISCEDIILKFLEAPHPSVVAEIKELIKEKNIELPISQMDWIECAPSLMDVVPKCDPFFISELIDSGYIPPASYSTAIELIISNIKKDDPRNEKLFKRALYIILKGAKALGFNHKMKLQNQYTKEWKELTLSFNDMLNDISENLKDTYFGKILASSLSLVCATIECVFLHFADIETIYAISIELASGFSEQCCALTSCLHKKFATTHHVGNKQKEKRMNDLATKFFKQQFPFDSACTVTSTALSCLGAADTHKYIGLYIEEAAKHSGSVLSMLLSNSQSSKVNIPISPVFLMAKDEKYMKKCVEQLPFNEWVITEDAGNTLTKLGVKDIKVTNVSDLNKSQRELIQTYPNLFIVEGQKLSSNDKEMVVHVDLSLGKEFGGFQEYNETVEEEPQFKCSFKPYPKEEPTIESISRFLWLSKRKVSEDQFKEIEESFLPFAKHTRAALSLVGYAMRHSFKLQTEKWAENIKVNVFDDKCLVLISLLTIAGGSSDAEKKMRENVSALLGLNYQEPFAFAMTAAGMCGIQRFVAESVICAEKERFDEFPFTKFIGKDKKFIEENLSELIGLCQQQEGENPPSMVTYATSAISRTIFPNYENTPYTSSIIPSGIEACKWIEHPRVGVNVSQQDFIDDNILDIFVKTFQEHPEYNIWIAPILSSSALSEEQHEQWINKLSDYYFEGNCGLHPIIAFLAARNQDGQFASDFAQTLEFCPPSYSTNVLRALLNIYTPEVDKKITDKLVKKMPKVFVETLPSGGSSYRRDINDNKLHAFYEASPYCNPLTTAAFYGVKEFFKTDEEYAALSLGYLVSLDEDIYNQICPEAEGKSYEIVAVVLLKIIITNWHYSDNVIASVDKLSTIVKPERLLEMISNDEFLKSYSTNLVVYDVLRRLLDKSFNEDKESAMKKAEELGNILNNDLLKKALQCNNREEALEIILADGNTK